MKAKKETPKDLMAELSEFTGLTWDGNEDDRLFADGEWFIHMNVVRMGRETYKAWEEALNSTQVKGPGFVVYAWNDVSGYDYWLREGMNYQQITVSIHNAKLASKDPKKIMDAVYKLDAKLAEFSRYGAEFAGVPTNEEIEEAIEEEEV